jgi:hypothetical protein
MPEPGAVIATRRHDGIPASVKFSIGGLGRARLAYAGAWADAIRGGHRLSHKAYCPGLTPIARSCHRGRWGTVAIRNGLLMMRKAHENKTPVRSPGLE